jgi:hypothetical protein
VNGIPGLLTPRVLGKHEGRGNLWQHPVPKASAGAQLVFQEAQARHARNEKEGLAAARSLGLYMVALKGDQMLLTGTLGKRSRKAEARYASPHYNLQCANVQVWARVANLCDLHCGNLISEKQSGGKPGAKAIDLDEALAPKLPEQLTFGNSTDSWILAAMNRPVQRIPAAVRQSLQSERCRVMNSQLRADLGPYLPKADLDQFAESERAMRESTVPDYGQDAIWEQGENLHPENWLLDAMIGFSAHEFGESEDSSSVEELDPPKAREVG